jgi:hypothetical protein
VSLWHKIFGSPADQVARLDEASKSIEQVAASDAELSDEASAIGDADDAIDVVPAGATALEEQQYSESEDEAAAVEGDDAVTDRNRRPRRRRRRRGGRGERTQESSSREHHRRKPESARIDAEDVEPIDDIAGDEDEDFSDLATERDGSGVDTNGDDTVGESRSRSLQRTIPSWDEAIGYIVELNMQSRSQRRQSSPSGSRGHAPRGRQRGRHKK